MLMARQLMKIFRQLHAERPSTRTMLTSRSRIMRKFSKQLMLIALGLVLSSSVAVVANAVPSDPNCPGVTNNAPLKANEAYGFTAFGADSSFGTNATVTMVGDIETDASGCPGEGFFAINDNGFPCVGTFTSVLSVNTSPVKTGSMTWTSATCFSTPVGLAWANAGGKTPTAMYFSSNGTSSALVVAGKLEDNGGSDGPTIVGTASVTTGARKHRHD